MLEKINFRNGVILSSALLNEMQKATVHNPRFPRSDYFGLPTASDEQIWYVGERDSVKDWEFPDPQLEPQSAMGRLAYDGIILGCKNCDLDSEEFVELEYGPPRVTYRDIISEPLPSSSEEVPSLGLFVNAGTYIDDSGQRQTWGVTSIIVELGNNYVYYDKLNQIVVANSVLPNKTTPHVPLARVEIGPLLVQDEFGEELSNPEVSRVTYEDLRPGLFIESSKSIELYNVSEVITDNYELQSWERIFVDSANGGINVTLPLNPVDGDKVAVFDISGTFDLYPVRLYAENSQTILRENLTWDLSNRFGHTELIYYEPIKMWVFSGQDLGLGSKEPLGEFISCGGTECLGIFEAEDCPHGEPIPAVFPNPSEGIYEYNSIESKCYKVLEETIAVYSDGEGGFIKVFKAPRCRKDLVDPQPYGADSRTIYVDSINGDDSVRNTGLSSKEPFRTIERALLETSKTRYKYSVSIAPGEYYVDNKPGTEAVFRAPGLYGYHNLVDSGLAVFSYSKESKTLVVYGGDQECYDPPVGLELGRTVYTQNGAFGTITYAERDKECRGECGWRFRIEGLRGNLEGRDTIYYNDLSHLNSKSGGIIVPKGTSLVGFDARKTTVRPMFVPNFSQLESMRSVDPNSDPSIFRLTSDSYIDSIGVGDNKSVKRYHNTLSTFTFAPQSEVLDRYESSSDRGYYYRVSEFLGDMKIFARYSKPRDTEIVSRAPFGRAERFSDIVENQTREPLSDRDGHPTLIRHPGDLSRLGTDIPDINSVEGGSPYIRNCTIKSIFGLNGLHADGNLVSGFKSMIADSLTVVSLQVDPVAYEAEGVYYYNDPAGPTNSAKRYKSDLTYRHYAYKASNEAFIQGSSAFVIGCADHFHSINGGEISLVGSSSNFGDISLRSEGFYPRAFTQDFAVKSAVSEGTRITKIVPPLPLEENLLTKRIGTGLRLLLDPSKRYYDSAEDNSVYRIYVESADTLNPFTQTNPPSADALGDYSYTKKNSFGDIIYAGNSDLRNSVYIGGVEGETYRSKFLINSSSLLHERSSIFKWDAEPPVLLNNLGNFTKQADKVIRFETVVDSVRANSFIRIDAQVYKVLSAVIEQGQTNVAVAESLHFESGIGKIAFLSSNDITGGRWYIEVQNSGLDNPYSARFISETLGEDSPALLNRSAIFILRAQDSRARHQRVYRAELRGFNPSQGLRAPQEGYILSKQFDLDPDGSDLERSDPLVLSNVVQGANTGEFFATLIYGSDLRSAQEGLLYPILDADSPEDGLSQGISHEAIWGRDGLRGFKDLGVLFKQNGTVLTEPNESNEAYDIYADLPDRDSEPLRIQLHRPSTIRSSSQMWEWVGYLGYDTALPKFQGPEFSEKEQLRKLFHEGAGGRIYASGMDQNGEFYVNNLPVHSQYYNGTTETRQDTGSFLGTDSPVQELYVLNRLSMGGGSDLVLANDSRIVQENGTYFDSESEALILGDRDKAGLVQLATDNESAAGQLSNKAVTPSGLAAAISPLIDPGVIDLGGGAVLDPEGSGGRYFSKIVDSNINFSVAGPLHNTKVYDLTLKIRHLSGTITFAPGVLWPEGTAPTLTEGHSHLIKLYSDSAGTNWLGWAYSNYDTEI